MSDVPYDQDADEPDEPAELDTEGMGDEPEEAG